MLAKELSTSGFDVVVLEQGPYRRAEDFVHDELAVCSATNSWAAARDAVGQTFRRDESEDGDGAASARRRSITRRASAAAACISPPTSGASASDFDERSWLGAIAGTNFADWPISYDELEPYYTKVDWEIGVSGAPGPYDAPRSKPFRCRRCRSSPRAS